MPWWMLGSAHRPTLAPSFGPPKQYRGNMHKTDQLPPYRILLIPLSGIVAHWIVHGSRGHEVFGNGPPSTIYIYGVDQSNARHGQLV
jgi:hypothetical protein